MGFRFQKRIRIFKGLTLNLSKSGTSWTLGGRGASVNFKEGKATGNVGTPAPACLTGSGWTTPAMQVQAMVVMSAGSFGW